MIETFIIAWNEADTIKFTLDHYLKFGKVNLFDNFSDDGTPDIADKMGAFVQSFGRQGVLDDREYLKIKNHIWKTSKADYVIVCDADEILQVNLKFLLQEKEKGVTIFHTFGFNVFSHKMPLKSFKEIKTGFPDSNFSKKVIFSPKLKAINYSYGCHECSPMGNITYSEAVVPLFHYRGIGGPDRMIARHKAYRKRLSDTNKRLKLGHHYLTDEKKKRKEWEACFQNSKEYSPGIIS